MIPEKTQIALTFGGNDTLTVSMTSIELVAFINGERKKDAEQAGAAFPSKGFAKLEHFDFMKKAPEVLGKDHGNFSDIYQDSYGRKQPAYRFPKREACLMAMSYSYALQAAVFDHMTALEQKLTQPTQPPVALPHDFISALEHLLESKKAEKLAIEQRDEAIRTKAQIGDRKTATAMATASAAKREANKLKEQLGFCTKHASVIAVEKAAHKKFAPQDWRKLRAWCLTHGVMAVAVPDTRWGEAKAWPAGAWMDVFGVDLVELLGEVAV